MSSERLVATEGEIGRRAFGRVVAGAAAVLAFSANRVAAAAMAPDIQAIKDRGQLVVGMTDFDSAPFYFTGETKGADASADPIGWDVDLARTLAQVLEVKLVFNRSGTSYNAIVDALAGGAIDIGISKLSVTPKRAVRVQFTHPTIELRHALLANRVTLASKVTDGNLREILNREFMGRIGVIAKSSYADIARQVFTHADVHEFDDWDGVVGATERGDVDLAYRDELEVKKLMRLRPELHLNLRSVLITDFRDSIAVAVPSASSQLLTLVNVVLSQRISYDANQLLNAYPNLFKA